MNPCGLLLIGIAILMGTNLPVMALAPSDLTNMTCHITTPDTEGCTGIPTLSTGILIISTDGTFELKAHYEGCFFMENVTISGKFNASHFKNMMSLELLTMQTAGVKDTIADFPRTLGFANLNYDKLDGYFVDISAVIRGRGRDTTNIITSKLQCEGDE